MKEDGLEHLFCLLIKVTDMVYTDLCIFILHILACMQFSFVATSVFMHRVFTYTWLF